MHRIHEHPADKWWSCALIQSSESLLPYRHQEAIQGTFEFSRCRSLHAYFDCVKPASRSIGTNKREEFDERKKSYGCPTICSRQRIGFTILGWVRLLTSQFGRTGKDTSNKSTIGRVLRLRGSVKHVLAFYRKRLRGVHCCDSLSFVIGS